MFHTDNVGKFSGDWAKVARFSPNRSTLPVLGFVLVDAKEDEVYLTATDLEQTILIRLTDVDVNEKTGICLPAKTAASLFSMWDDRLLTVEIEKRTMKATVNGGEGSKSKAELKGLDPEEFPPYRSMLKGDFKPEVVYTVNTADFAAAVSRVAICASGDESRPILSAVHFVQKGEELILEAADGFRLGRDSIAVEASKKNVKTVFSACVPAKTVLEVSKIMEGETIQIGFDNGENGQVRFVSGNVEVASVTVQGNYPDVDQIIPKKKPIVATLNTKIIRSGCEAGESGCFRLSHHAPYGELRGKLRHDPHPERRARQSDGSHGCFYRYGSHSRGQGY